MPGAGFHPELRALLEDPITRDVMASDGVAMGDLVALLEHARGHLVEKAAGQKAKGRHRAGPSIGGLDDGPADAPVGVRRQPGA